MNELIDAHAPPGITLFTYIFAPCYSRAIMRYAVNALAPDSPLYSQCPQQRALVDRALDYDLGILHPLVAACVVSPRSLLSHWAFVNELRSSCSAIHSQLWMNCRTRALQFIYKSPVWMTCWARTPQFIHKSPVWQKSIKISILVSKFSNNH